MDVAAARQEFSPAGTYLNTATAGLPPRRAVEAYAAAAEAWRTGRADAAGYDAPVAAARAGYARLVGVPAGQVAIGPQASVFAGLVAASLPDDACVLVAAGDFTSIVFPFLAQQRRGVRVREVPLEALADAVARQDGGTTLVAVSAVQSADGRLADLPALRRAAAEHGARVLLDVTQAAGWLPVDAGAWTYTVCSGYKWLLAPRGTTFFTVQAGAMDALVPHHASWYGGQDRWSSIYGGPLRLADDARRFDVSPAWHSWVAAAPALDLLNQVGSAALHGHALGLANAFRAGAGLPPGDSAIVSLATDGDVGPRLAAAGIATAVRAGRLRLSFHVNNTGDDVAAVLDALGGRVRPS